MATKYWREDRNAWYLQYTEGGVQKRPSLGRVTKAEAEAARIALERRLQSDRPSAGPLFSDWAEDYGIWHSEEWPDSYFRIKQIIEQHLSNSELLPPLGYRFFKIPNEQGYVMYTIYHGRLS